MEIEALRTVYGPNMFHHKPVIQLTVDLKEMADTDSTEIPTFTNAVLGMLPGLHTHRCSKGYEGGFVERLRSGTYLAHITEHVILELTTLAGFPVGFGKTVYAGRPGLYLIAVRFLSEHGTRFLCKTAVELVNSLLRNQSFDLAKHIEEAKEISGNTDLGPSTRAVIHAAELRNIPWRRLNDQSLIQLGYGKGRKLIQATETAFTSSISVDIAKDKHLSKHLLRDGGVSIPDGTVAYSEEEAVAAFKVMGSPLTLKPLDGNQGRGVCLNVRTEQGVRDAYDIAARSAGSAGVIVERYLQGKDYRVLLVNHKIVAASERTPACIVGDGTSNIKQLIDQENKNPLRGTHHQKPLSVLVIDKSLQFSLAKRGISLDHVPQKGEQVFLRETANLSTGGTATDVTDLLHPDYRSLCERAARIIGLDICGIDLISPDISSPLSPEAGIVEVNAAPGIRMHHFPSYGKARDVAGAIIEMIYPDPLEARVPIIGITGTNGKTTVTRLIAHMLANSGSHVGVTTTEGIYINGNRVPEGDTTGPISARAVLSDNSVDVAVLEVARGGIMRGGLGYDWSDIGVITNIRADHIGQDGLETIDDIIHVKSLVAERVRSGGTIILNGCDPGCLKILHNRKQVEGKNIVLFGIEKNEEIQEHVRNGGTAYYVENGQVLETFERTRNRVVAVSAIPLTLGGLAKFQTENVLAAIAASRAHGLGEFEIAASLGSYRTSSNSGRMNLYRVGSGILIVDYGHNAHALEALSEVTAALRKDRKVTGVIAVPGDRADTLLLEAARAAAGAFDRIIVREDADTRGRTPGEGADLISNEIARVNPSLELSVVLDESESLRAALDTMIQDEVVFYFYEDKLAYKKVLLDYKAREIDYFPDFDSSNILAAA